MASTILLSPSAIMFFSALAKGNKLKWLNITGNLISDEACDAIAATMIDNASLIWLWMGDNKISAQAAEQLVQALQHNSTLELLRLPCYSEDAKRRIRVLQKEVTKNFG